MKDFKDFLKEGKSEVNEAMNARQLQDKAQKIINSITDQMDRDMRNKTKKQFSELLDLFGEI